MGRRPPNFFSHIDRLPRCALARVGPLDLRSEAEFSSALRADTPSVPLSRPEQDEHETAQTSVRHHSQLRSAMRQYAVAHIDVATLLISSGKHPANQPKLKWPTWMFRRHG